MESNKEEARDVEDNVGSSAFLRRVWKMLVEEAKEDVKTNSRLIFYHQFKLGRSAAEMARDINEVWSERSFGASTVRAWFRKFLFGEFDLEDKEDRRRSNELDDDELRAPVEANTPTTVQEFAE
ncbi:unnamed protein product [Angiostrongylus costaricensis]|uniref:HTH_48 domain-containing protein n=1 Tax=Angiostrongylus costaricensis TaxID=334426 RepID=A0A0R3PBA7_ANGCS|nr:unnamed protein product [Angiostrongylus costaricensis]